METICDQYRDGDYLEQHPAWHAERSPWKASQVVRGLRAVNRAAPESVCDIGCGAGLVLSLVAKELNVNRAVGFEPSPDAPIHPDAKAIVDLRREDATESNERFDVSIMLDVFEHVEDYLGFLRACRSLAKLHVFHIPLDLSAKSILTDSCMKARRATGHLHYYSRTTALATLEDAGFKPIHWHYTKSSWEGPGRRPWSMMNLSRRSLFAISQDFTQNLLGGLALLVVAEADNA